MKGRYGIGPRPPPGAFKGKPLIGEVNVSPIAGGSLFRLTVLKQTAHLRASAAELGEVGMVVLLLALGALALGAVAWNEREALPFAMGVALCLAPPLFGALRHRRSLELRWDPQAATLTVGGRVWAADEIAAVLVVSRPFPVDSVRFGLQLCFAQRPPRLLAVDRVPDNLSELASVLRRWLRRDAAEPTPAAEPAGPSLYRLDLPSGTLQVTQLSGELRLLFRRRLVGAVVSLAALAVLASGSFWMLQRRPAQRSEALLLLAALAALVPLWALMRFCRETSVVLDTKRALRFQRRWIFAGEKLGEAEVCERLAIQGVGEGAGVGLFVRRADGSWLRLLVAANFEVQKLAASLVAVTGLPLSGAVAPKALLRRPLLYQDSLAGFRLTQRLGRPLLEPAPHDGPWWRCARWALAWTLMFVGAGPAYGLLGPLLACVLVPHGWLVSRCHTLDASRPEGVCLLRRGVKIPLPGPVQLESRRLTFYKGWWLLLHHAGKSYKIALADRPDILDPLERDLRQALDARWQEHDAP